MKKKILSLVLAICFIVPSMFIFSACGEKEEVGLKNNYKITVIQTSNGVISPDFVLDSNTIELVEGSSYTFYIAAEEGYKIENLVIDGNVKPASSTYTFIDIRDNHTIAASFVSSEDVIVLKSLSGIKVNYKVNNLEGLTNEIYRAESLYIGEGNTKRITDMNLTSLSTVRLNQNKSADNGYDYIYNDANKEIKIVDYTYKSSDISKDNCNSFYVDFSDYELTDVKFVNGSAKIKGTLKLNLAIQYDYFYYREFRGNSIETKSFTIDIDTILNLSNIKTIEANYYDNLYSLTINIENPIFSSVELMFE